MMGGFTIASSCGSLHEHAGHAQNAREAWGTIHFIPLLNACLQLDESETLDIEGFAHELVPWEPSQEAGGGYASESDASDVSHAFINASVQTMSQMDGTWELATSDGAPHR